MELAIINIKNNNFFILRIYIKNLARFFSLEGICFIFYLYLQGLKNLTEKTVKIKL